MMKKFMKNLVENTFTKHNMILLLIEIVGIGLCIAADLLTKEYIYGPIANGAADIIIIEGVIRFTAVENTGASFGIFEGKTNILAIFSITVVVVIFIVQVFSISNRNALLRASLVLIIAGGIGNVIDRFALGFVRDFIYFELIDFAVFNVADSCLTIGNILLVIYVIFCYKPDKKPKKETENGN